MDITVLSWIAVCLLSISYWFQIWKIHKHREVRDLSVPYYVLLIIGYCILAYTAMLEDSTIFLVKQIATGIPVLIILAQIKYHWQDHWHDDDDEYCVSCGEELEPDWIACPYCGERDQKQSN